MFKKLMAVSLVVFFTTSFAIFVAWSRDIDKHFGCLYSCEQVQVALIGDPYLTSEENCTYWAPCVRCVLDIPGGNPYGDILVPIKSADKKKTSKWRSKVPPVCGGTRWFSTCEPLGGNFDSFFCDITFGVPDGKCEGKVFQFDAQPPIIVSTDGINE